MVIIKDFPPEKSKGYCAGGVFYWQSKQTWVFLLSFILSATCRHTGAVECSFQTTPIIHFQECWQEDSCLA